jgi:hypothetical protein
VYSLKGFVEASVKNECDGIIYAVKKKKYVVFERTDGLENGYL